MLWRSSGSQLCLSASKRLEVPKLLRNPKQRLPRGWGTSTLRAGGPSPRWGLGRVGDVGWGHSEVGAGAVRGHAGAPQWVRGSADGVSEQGSFIGSRMKW